ncbi:hypothetical protein DdX_19996 [Ditylenchus destructor]|uniref:Lipoprotein n=1 Tax=Ditylenchus destructor TaxID=166010 RepID=A0AAD4MLL7_9BILA|nr:hypothetical protein DdX_19996 [Ditylenchus destructor]
MLPFAYLLLLLISGCSLKSDGYGYDVKYSNEKYKEALAIFDSIGKAKSPPKFPSGVVVNGELTSIAWRDENATAPPKTDHATVYIKPEELLDAMKISMTWSNPIGQSANRCAQGNWSVTYNFYGDDDGKAPVGTEAERLAVVLYSFLGSHLKDVIEVIENIPENERSDRLKQRIIELKALFLKTEEGISYFWKLLKPKFEKYENARRDFENLVRDVPERSYKAPLVIKGEVSMSLELGLP